MVVQCTRVTGIDVAVCEAADIDDREIIIVLCAGGGTLTHAFGLLDTTFSDWNNHLHLFNCCL